MAFGIVALNKRHIKIEMRFSTLKGIDILYLICTICLSVYGLVTTTQDVEVILAIKTVKPTLVNKCLPRSMFASTQSNINHLYSPCINKGV